MKRCCCDCCTVRTGTLIIGILTLISAAHQVGKYCVVLTVAIQQLCTMGDLSAKEIKYTNYTDDKIDELTHDLKIGIAISLAGLLIYLTQLCLTVSLLRGVSKDNHRPILPWYYFNVVMFVVGVVVTAGITIGFLVTGQHLAALFLVIAATLLFWLGWFFLSVVKDYIDELQTGYIRENLTMVIPGIATEKIEKV